MNKVNKNLWLAYDLLPNQNFNVETNTDINFFFILILGWIDLVWI